MNAVQVMRQRAQQSGNLKSTQQQTVTVQNQAPGAAPPPPPARGCGAPPARTVIVQPPPQTIIIQPAQPTVVYVPTYNPTVVYGAPVPVYPGYSTGDMVADQPDLVRRGNCRGRGHQRRRRLLRLGMEFVGMRLAQLHRGLQPQYLHLQFEYLRQPQQLLQLNNVNVNNYNRNNVNATTSTATTSTPTITTAITLTPTTSIATT